MKRDMNLIRELLQTLDAAATDRGFSFEEREAETLKCTLDQIRYNLQQAEEMGLIVVGSKPLNGEWIILRLTPRGHDFLESGRNTQRLLMNAPKEPECITLAEGLALLECHLSAEQAKVRLRQAFTRKAFPQSPLFAFEYDEADIDWATGSVKIPRKRDRFVPTFLRADFNAYFFEDRVASTSHPRQTAIHADMREALGAQASDEDILSGRAVQAGVGMSSPTPLNDSTTVETSSPPQPKEMLTLKPTFMGMSLDLKELFRRAKAWWKQNK